MNTIKGLVLISRFEYIEKKIGDVDLKKIVSEISSPDENYVKQPIIGSNNYPGNSIAKIDQILLTNYFNNKYESFRELGKWNADNFMHRFFNLYLDQHTPVDFVFQYARLRQNLIGSGVMEVFSKDNRNVKVTVDYGQHIPRSVCLSEQGFLEQGVLLCGARSVKIKESSCAGLSDNMICVYQLTIT